MAAKDKRKTVVDEQAYASNVYYQNNSEMFMEFIRLLAKYPTCYGKMLKKAQNHDMLDWLHSNLQFLDNGNFKFEDYCMSEIVYLAVHGMTDFPVCQICGNPISSPRRFQSYGFMKGCTNRCSYAVKVHTFEQTSLKRYGVRHPLKDKTAYAEYCHKLEKRFGIRNTFQLDTAKRQIKATKKKNHGSENYVNTDKARQTRKSKYNGQWESCETKKRRKAAFKMHYGVENNMQSKKGVKEYEDALEKTFGKGIRNVSQIPLVQAKKRQKYQYHSEQFDSGAELAFYIWLEDQQIPFEYQPSMPFDYKFNGKVYKYFPDFKVRDIFVEIKGDQFFKDGKMVCPYRRKDQTNEQYKELCDKHEAKHQCMLANGVLIMTSVCYMPYIRYVEDRYGKEYLQSFRAPLKVNSNCNEECSQSRQARDKD